LGNIIDITEAGTLAVDHSLSSARHSFRYDSEWMAAKSGGLHPKLFAALDRLDRRDTGNLIDWELLDRAFYSSRGDQFRIGEGYRTPERQALLYAQSRTSAGERVTNSAAYMSYHQWGLSADLVITRYGYENVTIEGRAWDFSKPAAWLRTGVPQFLESQGLTWGGRWTDLVDVAHFQLTVPVPRDNAFAGFPWWTSAGVDMVALPSRNMGTGQAWVVAGLVAGGMWLLKKRG